MLCNTEQLALLAPDTYDCPPSQGHSGAPPPSHPSHSNLLETKPMKSINIPLVTFIVATCLVVSSLASAQSTLDIDEQRAATLKKLESDVPDPDEIRRIAKETYSKPISAQDTDVLQSLAKQSNGYANMVNFIKDEYDDYRRENYSYDFVLEKLNPSLGHYARNRERVFDHSKSSIFQFGNERNGSWKQRLRTALV